MSKEETKPAMIDLNKIGQQITELFGKGMTDDGIAGKVGLTVQQVSSIRNMLGLQRKFWGSVFDKWKKLGKDNTNQQYVITIRIPHEKADIIGLKWDNDYQFMANCSKNELSIDFTDVIE